jgi:hypothetical protein
MVQQPGDYRWSSYAHHTGQRAEPWLTPHPLFWELGNTPFAREIAYANLVQTGIASVQQAALTDATLRGWALGEPRFVADLQKLTPRRVSKTAAGRPPLAATLDVATHHEQALVADPTLVRRVLEPLIRRAMESAAEPDATCESPVVREVVITSIDVGSAIEIEVADSGPALPDPVRRWLNETADGFHASSIAPDGAGLALAAIRAAAARIDGTLSAANCPEGGVAITLRLPRRQAQRLAA